MQVQNLVKPLDSQGLVFSFAHMLLPEGKIATEKKATHNRDFYNTLFSN